MILGMFVTFLIVGYILNTTVLLLLFGLFGVLPIQPPKKYGEYFFSFVTLSVQGWGMSSPSAGGWRLEPPLHIS